MGLSTYSRNGIANGFINGVPSSCPSNASLHDGNPAMREPTPRRR